MSQDMVRSTTQRCRPSRRGDSFFVCVASTSVVQPGGRASNKVNDNVDIDRCVHCNGPCHRRPVQAGR
jgi:hypothetical protein